MPPPNPHPHNQRYRLDLAADGDNEVFTAAATAMDGSRTLFSDEFMRVDLGGEDGVRGSAACMLLDPVLQAAMRYINAGHDVGLLQGAVDALVRAADVAKHPPLAKFLQANSHICCTEDNADIYQEHTDEDVQPNLYLIKEWEQTQVAQITIEELMGMDTDEEPHG